ncbi:hypothetical protein F5Y00DRAFT_38501 [Daldinia vernicosa]|uniref:uncharacterized protein n=1 Tax=Daldinia vernicosa TaxID=114800 RepID=UPI00200817AC|nr:uncharacterized protein F5Y00DRAFT_38501 [Daldinia vernicosa]KAI0850460.1 hypothetical protein F5Y00DRAFT_38501 [Daldinia vernicosa]
MSSGSQEAVSQLETVLASTMENKEVRVVALTTHIGEGKSTAVIDRIWRQAKVGKAPPTIIYVVSTLTESALLHGYLSEGKFTPDELDSLEKPTGRPISIRSASEFLQRFGELHEDQDRTVVVDITWYPNLEDEIALGGLIKWLSGAKEKGLSICCVLLMSEFESQRTVAAFEKWVGNVLRVDLTGSRHPKVRIEVQQGEGWKDQVRQTLLDALDQEKKVVVATNGLLDLEYLGREPFESKLGQLSFEDHETVNTVAGHLAVLKRAPVIVVDAETPFSTNIKDLGVVVSLGSSLRTNLLIPKLMQVVRKDRDLSWLEVLRQHSWASKSAAVGGSGPSAVRFLCPAGEEELKARGEHAEDLGRAWNEDFMFTALACFYNWPGRRLSRMPTRQPPNDYVFADAVRRLLVLGCIREGKQEGTYECTPLGTCITRMRQNEFKDKFNFHVTYFLARIQLRRLKDESPEVLRVLIRLAAIAHFGVKFLYHFAEEMDADKLRKWLPALIRGRAHAGAMWIALGAYLLCEAVGLGREDTGMAAIGLGAVDLQVLATVSIHVQLFERQFDLGDMPRDASGWMNKALTEAQLRSIDEDMMWAWLHRIGSFEPAGNPSGAGTMVDWVSLEEFGVKMNKEIIQESDIREYCNATTEGRGAFSAFYLLLKEKDGKRWARHLTWIPPEAIQDLKEKTGLSVTTAVGKTF